jgi:hypothetical protein
LNVLEALKEPNNRILESNKNYKISKPSFTGANLDSDRESFICCNCFGNGRGSVKVFLGLTISHLTRILFKELKIRESKLVNLSNLLGANLSRSSLVIEITFP